MVPARFAGKNRAPLGAGFVAHGDDIIEKGTALNHRRDRLCPVARNVEARFAQCFDHDWIELARLDPGTLGVETIAGDLVEECLRHLAASAVMNANEEDLFFQLSLAQGSLLTPR